MMTGSDDRLRELYQEVIFDHNRQPRNFHPMADADHVAEGNNPLCGDQLVLYLRVRDGRVAEASFTGHGCAISTASASLLTEAVKDRSLADADALFRDFQALLTEPDPQAARSRRDFGKLEALAGVREFPLRVKCATLAWHTLHNALTDAGSPASTE